MSNLKLLSKIFFFLLFFPFITQGTEPVDIWGKKEKKEEIKVDTNKKIENKNQIKININQSVEGVIDYEKISDEDEIIGLFDPGLNDLSLSIWSNTDGNEIKNILARIKKLQLSPYAQKLLFNVLLTNAYSPKSNLSNEEFLEIKIKWLISKNQKEYLEKLLLTNPAVGKKTKAVRFLVDDNLAVVNISSACDKVKLLNKDAKDFYLEKFNIVCLINQNREDEASLYFDMLIERGLEDKFFEDKINFLLGITSKTTQKINDKNLLYFYLSQTTVDEFNYKPNKKTSRLIWRYLTSSNLINFGENEIIEEIETIKLYESAAAEGTFNKEEIFNIYKRYLFNVNQLLNVSDAYKTLPKYKARALVYQSILLSENVETKIRLIFLLKDLFEKDKLENIFSNEIKRLLKEIDRNEIPENFLARVDFYIQDKYKLSSNIKFDNNVIHRSKLIKYFLEDNYPIKKLEKDFKLVHKKVKKNKKYFISIKDIILLETLKHDGIKIPAGLDYEEFAEKLTIPQGLQDMVDTNQTGLAILKIIEIIGADSIRDLDPETIYFLNKILNQLKVKKIRNQILSQALPLRV
tara:strand:+ start:827 stop:2557 length:1731 start_codon:yes stop_codon:yes gene_type:complete